MKKLNNRGLTTIELLISFVLLAILVVSLYGTVETYKNRQSIEEFKDEIYTYKNLLTKEVQSDLIKKGLIDVKIENTPLDASNSANIIPEKYKATFYFRDGSHTVLETTRIVADDYGASATTATTCPSGRNDKFVVSYGTDGNMYDYPLPSVGYGTNDEGCMIEDLRIASINMTATNKILKIHIIFYHPDFGNKYGINIVTPINFNR